MVVSSYIAYCLFFNSASGIQHIVLSRSGGGYDYESTTTNRVAWLHIPKCGVSLGNLLAHYANFSLPPVAAIEPSGKVCGGREKSVALKFSARWKNDLDFKNLFWKGKAWAGHR